MFKPSKTVMGAHGSNFKMNIRLRFDAFLSKTAISIKKAKVSNHVMMIVYGYVI